MSKTSAKGADQKEYGRACLRILISYYLATELETLGVDPVGSEKASASVSALSVKRILPDQWIRHRVDPFSWDPASRFREKSTGSRSIIEWEWIRHHGMGVDPVGSEKASLGENGHFRLFIRVPARSPAWAF